MMIEQMLEAKIVEAIRQDGVYYSRAWDVTEDGAVKGDEPASTGAVVSVNVSPRQMDSYSGGVEYVAAEFPVSISLAMSADADPTGAALIGLYERVASVVWDWVKDVDCVAETALTLTRDGVEVFTPGGVMQTSGSAPTYSSAARMWVCSLSFTVRGIIKE